MRDHIYRADVHVLDAIPGVAQVLGPRGVHSPRRDLICLMASVQICHAMLTGNAISVMLTGNIIPVMIWDMSVSHAMLHTCDTNVNETQGGANTTYIKCTVTCG